MKIRLIVYCNNWGDACKKKAREKLGWVGNSYGFLSSYFRVCYDALCGLGDFHNLSMIPQFV